MYKTVTPPTLAVLTAGIFGSIAVNVAYASILGDFGSGWNAGKSAAYRALYSGHQYDASCPTSYIDHKSYCTGYHSGYFEEWSALRGAHPPVVNMTNATVAAPSNFTQQQTQRTN